METRTKESLIQELYKTATGSDFKKDGGASRFVARTNTLSGNPQDYEDDEELSREKRKELTLQKDEYYEVSTQKCRCALVKGDILLGDTLVIRELDGFTQTGTFLVKNVSYVIRGKGLQEGYCIACWE